MPESFVETSDGVVLYANGIDAVQRWDGYSSDSAVAGVAPPYSDYILATNGSISDEQPVLSSSGVGALEGTYRCAVRYVDENGDYSDLSAFSDEAVVAAADQFDYSNLPTPTQPTVVRRQILRNTDGQTDTFYVDIDTTDLASTTLSSDRTDEDLATQEAVPLFDVQGKDIANVWGMPPNTKPFIEWHQNRLYYLGVKSYVEGSISVNSGDYTVYGHGTAWPSTLAQRYIWIDGADKPYRVDFVDPTTQLITLSELYTGDDLRYASYAIKPTAIEDVTGYFSETNKPAAVPALNAFVFPQDGDDVTGGMNFQSFLFILKRRSMYKLTTRRDPITDGQVYLGIRRGCINTRCKVVANEIAYLLDEGGVYAFMGDGQGQSASVMIQDFFRRDSFGKIGINWSASRTFHAAHSPQEEVIRWFVCLGGDTLPKTALAYGYGTQRWWTEHYEHPIGASCLGRVQGYSGALSEGQEQVYYGSDGGRIYAANFAGLDGVVRALAARGTVTGSAPWTMTDSTRQFGPVEEASLVMVTGRARGATRRVFEVAGGTLRLDRPWDVLPEAGDVYQVGGVPLSYQMRRVRYTVSELTTNRAAEINYYPVEEIVVPQTLRVTLKDDYRTDAKKNGRRMDGSLALRMSAEKDEAGTDVRIDQTGYEVLTFRGGREGSAAGPHSVVIGVDGVAGPERVRINSILLTGIQGFGQ